MKHWYLYTTVHGECPQNHNLNVHYLENLKSHAHFIVHNVMSVRFERQTMTDGMLVCIMLHPASYNVAGVERSERAGTCTAERKSVDLFNYMVSC